MRPEALTEPWATKPGLASFGETPPVGGEHLTIATEFSYYHRVRFVPPLRRPRPRPARSPVRGWEVRRIFGERPRRATRPEKAPGRLHRGRWVRSGKRAARGPRRADVPARGANRTLGDKTWFRFVRGTDRAAGRRPHNRYRILRIPSGLFGTTARLANPGAAARRGGPSGGETTGLSESSGHNNPSSEIIGRIGSPVLRDGNMAHEPMMIGDPDLEGRPHRIMSVPRRACSSSTARPGRACANP
jgi:hypothetical protein